MHTLDLGSAAAHTFFELRVQLCQHQPAAFCVTRGSLRPGAEAMHGFDRPDDGRTNEQERGECDEMLRIDGELIARYREEPFRNQAGQHRRHPGNLPARVQCRDEHCGEEREIRVISIEQWIQRDAQQHREAHCRCSDQQPLPPRSRARAP